MYDQVLGLALAITNAGERCRPANARGAFRRLRGLYRAKLKSPDPFLTETLADFTGGDRAAAKLYRLSLRQSASFPGEVIYTKQVALAERLVRLGYFAEAATLVAAARSDAEAAEDAVVLDQLLEVESACGRGLGVAS